MADPTAILHRRSQSSVGMSSLPETHPKPRQKSEKAGRMSQSHGRARDKRTVEVELEGLVGDVLVDEQPLVAVDAVANEGDEVAVVDAADALDLGAELAVALPAAGPEPLDGHLPLPQRAAVHVPEPALPQQVGVREAARRRRQVRVRHRAARHRRRRRRMRLLRGRGEPVGRGGAGALP